VSGSARAKCGCGACKGGEKNTTFWERGAAGGSPKGGDFSQATCLPLQACFVNQASD